MRVARLLALALAAPLLAAGCREEDVLPRERVTGGSADRGERAILTYGCGSCHVIPGVQSATGLVGPSLDGVADRTYLAGQVENDAEAMVQWIRFPQRARPGGVMPDLGVSDADARDIAAFLYTLRARQQGPPHPISRRVLPAH